MKRALAWLLIQTILAVHRAATAWRRAPRAGLVPTEGADVLLTGTFYSENWIGAHIGPLARSRHCRRVLLVTTTSAAEFDKLEVIRPHPRLQALLGGVPARLLTFAWTAIRRRPQVVGGFHLLINGLVAGVVAPLAGARSLYFCVGGPEEFREGGIHGENRLFSLLEKPDLAIEERLIEATRRFSLVVTMGQGAARFFREHGARGQVEVVPGGIDGSRFFPGSEPRTIDLLLVGRLVPIKRVDLFLQAVALAAERRPGLTAAVIGDGPLKAALEAQAVSLGLTERVAFLGRRSDVEDHLRRARLFVLTSDSEGLALSVMEAMTCGVPAIVPHVGDLPDLVQDGRNGYLVKSRAPEAYAERFLDLLEDPERWSTFSQNALEDAGDYSVAATTSRWDRILGGESGA